MACWTVVSVCAGLDDSASEAGFGSGLSISVSSEMGVVAEVAETDF